MSTLFLRYVRDKVEVTDAEVKGYFEKNAKRMQKKYHVWQIFYKGKYPEVVKDYQDLKSGTPFEKVAARRFPNLPPNVKAPWDIARCTGIRCRNPGKTLLIVSRPPDEGHH